MIMTEQCSFTGDLIIAINSDGDWDLNYINGQPCMTDGFDTAVLLSIFGEPTTWQNGLTNNPSEQYISEFPDLIKRANVSDATIKDGVQAIKRALEWMKTDGIAQTIEVTGEATSVYTIIWTIDIDRGTIDNRYNINWDRQIIQIQGFKTVDAVTIPYSGFYLYEKLTASGDYKVLPDGTGKLAVIGDDI